MTRKKKKAAKKKAPRKKTARKPASKPARKKVAKLSRAEIDPAAMSIEMTARLLSTVSEAQITKEMIEADLADGAPTNRGGKINLVHYTAWLARERTAWSDPRSGSRAGSSPVAAP